MDKWTVSCFTPKTDAQKSNFFAGGNIQRNDGEEDDSEESLFKLYFDSLTSGKHSFTKGSKIIKSIYTFKKYQYGNPANFLVLGEGNTTEFIMKTELSEVPISGDLTFKSFVVEYPKAKKSYFRPVALEIAKTFGQ